MSMGFIISRGASGITNQLCCVSARMDYEIFAVWSILAHVDLESVINIMQGIM